MKKTAIGQLQEGKELILNGVRELYQDKYLSYKDRNKIVSKTNDLMRIIVQSVDREIYEKG